jgi:membrane-bound ClpP family serine protease
MTPDPWVIPTVIGVSGGIIAFIIYHARRAHHRQPTTGREELTGKKTVVKVALEPEGTVLHQGELWTAVLDKGRAKPGEEVFITKFDSMKLYVTKKQQKRR